MTILPLNPTDDPTPAALRAFLGQCAARAAEVGRPQLVSISLAVERLDPLAVLESIFEPGEPHFYAECLAQDFALAAAESVVACTAEGPERFATAQTFIHRTLADTIAVGPLHEPLAGPHFLFAATFADHAEPDAPFPALQLFVPRWQVSRQGDTSLAVANLLVTPEMPLDLITEKVWRAHTKFRTFDYSSARNRNRPPAPPDTALPATEATNYQAAVRTALDEIARGDYQKVVLARRRELTASEEFHPLGVLNHLRQRFPDCWAFSVANGRGQSFIGATPERLVRVATGRMRTEALAGSAPRGTTASEDATFARTLLKNEKELREHRLVLEAIRRRLSNLPLRLEHADSPRLLALANVQHLHTPIEAALPADVSLFDLVGRLHPTPAVGGSPRTPALAALHRLESFDRGLYAGPLGWVNHRGDGEALVALRSALVAGRHATAYAGAGIVAGSDPAAEFAETELKFKALLDALTRP